MQTSVWCGRWQGVPKDEGVWQNAYFPRFPHGCGFYASPLEPTGLQDLESPTLVDAEMGKISGSNESRVVEEPRNVAGVSSEEGEARDLLKCSEGAETSAMALDEALRDAPMYPLLCPHLTDALESPKNSRLNTVERTSENSGKMIGWRPSHSREDSVATIPFKSFAPFVKTQQALLGADAGNAGPTTPTRRRASAMRRFPYGCGPRSPVLTRQEVEELRARAQSGTASNSRMRERGLGSWTERVKKNSSLACFISKESGGGTKSYMGDFKCIENFAAQVVKKEDIKYDGGSPAHKSKLFLGDRKTSSHMNGKGSHISLAKALASPQPKHTVKATVSSVSKDKAFLMCEGLPPTAGKRAHQSKNESSIQLYQKCSTQQFGKCGKFVDNRKRKPEETDARKNVKRILSHFRLFQDKDTRTKHLGKTTRPDLKILGLLKEQDMIPVAKYLGEVPGVEIGDKFHYRGELMATGLHCSPVAGIDCMMYKGMRVATCIISSGVYMNFIDGTGVLVYSGEGGNPTFEKKRKKPTGDQKLERGNLALKNSIDTKTPVRVIHGLRDPGAAYSLKSAATAVVTYIYDGLYKVERFWPEMGNMGYKIFKFQLRRLPGQPELTLKLVRNVRGVKTPQYFFVDDTTQVRKKKLSCIKSA